MSRFLFAALFAVVAAKKGDVDEAPKNAVVDYFMGLFNDVFGASMGAAQDAVVFTPLVSLERPRRRSLSLRPRSRLGVGG